MWPHCDPASSAIQKLGLLHLHQSLQASARWKGLQGSVSQQTPGHALVRGNVLSISHDYSAPLCMPTNSKVHPELGHVQEFVRILRCGCHTKYKVSLQERIIMPRCSQPSWPLGLGWVKMFSDGWKVALNSSLQEYWTSLWGGKLHRFKCLLV